MTSTAFLPPQPGIVPSHLPAPTPAAKADVCERAAALAERLLTTALSQQTRAEHAEAAKLGRLMDDPAGKAFTFAMVDEVFRSHDPAVEARRWRGLLDRFGVPQYPPLVDRVLMRLGGAGSRVLPGVVMKAVAARMRADSARVILPGEREPLNRYLTTRTAEGFRINLNHLGEAVLGEEEASRRLTAVLGHLADPAVNYISVKISAIFSQINLVAWDETLAEIKARLRTLYRAGAEGGKFVNLDMEEYRDLALTVAAFREVLDEPEFRALSAGIVLQAYLPDSCAAQRELTDWARARVSGGGAPIKIRLVKGANLAMESVEAELHGWHPAPYGSKAETDANFRRLLEYGCDPANAAAVRLGVASHNLFDVALALTLREANGVGGLVEIEMLEGMANHQARAVRDAAGGLLLYAPAVQHEDFLSAMAYLVRRLEENTAPENFLRDMFAMRPGSDEWERQHTRFVQGWNERATVSAESRRATSAVQPALAADFENEPDTDWTQASARTALADAIHAWQPEPLHPSSVPEGQRKLAGGRASVASEHHRIGGFQNATAPAGAAEDSSTPAGVHSDSGLIRWLRSFLASPPANFRCPSGTQQSGAVLADVIVAWQPAPLPELPALDAMLRAAVAAQPAWAASGVAHRARILNLAAELMGAQRFTTLACLRVDGKKAVADADGEVSEAIDFARYYARTADAPQGVKADALGIVAVVSPWNFPYSIPAGGVLAALMAGNVVVLKPARTTAQTAWLLARQLWVAGVPRDVLHFFPCDGTTGRALITDPRIACVILTGGYETARQFQSWRPTLPLLAETSGKNALIITAQADRELAIKDLVRSAFGHAGQKCSAASLALLEAEVYDDPIFRRQLRDAAASLPAGAASDPRSVVTPLVIAPGNDLRRALTTLDDGEEWLLEPRQLGDDPCAWTPGIRLGVRPGSWFHQTECFGPVLGLMRTESLAQATEWQNATHFGLTAGLHSLDPAEVAWWKERVQAGNLYINRPITGAIVQRQPFGGWKRSCIGPGAKAGGPNYVLSFCRLSDAVAVEDDYRAAWASHFAIEHDPSALRCESNVFRYRPCRGVILRLEKQDRTAVERAQFAAKITGVSLSISIREEESDAQFIARLPELAKRAEFLRTVAAPGDEVLRAAHDAGLNWIDAPLVASGRIELTRWLREQSISETRHRYGQVPGAATARRGCSTSTRQL